MVTEGQESVSTGHQPMERVLNNAKTVFGRQSSRGRIWKGDGHDDQIDIPFLYLSGVAKLNKIANGSDTIIFDNGLVF